MISSQDQSFGSQKWNPAGGLGGLTRFVDHHEVKLRGSEQVCVQARAGRADDGCLVEYLLDDSRFGGACFVQERLGFSKQGAA